MSWRRSARMLAVVPLFALALPSLAGAQTIETVHPVNFNLKVVFQDDNRNGDLRIGKDSGNAKDVFEICTGIRPTSTQGIFLTIDCLDPNQNRIVLANTNPVSVIETVGTLDLEMSNLVESENSNGDTTKAMVPAELHFNCDGGALQIEASGVVTVNFKALPNGGMICPNSATLQMSGVGELLSDDLIIDVGSKFEAKNRSSSIVIPLP
jgi:hypothetical protein